MAEEKKKSTGVTVLHPERKDDPKPPSDIIDISDLRASSAAPAPEEKAEVKESPATPAPETPSVTTPTPNLIGDDEVEFAILLVATKGYEKIRVVEDFSYAGKKFAPTPGCADILLTTMAEQAQVHKTARALARILPTTGVAVDTPVGRKIVPFATVIAANIMESMEVAAMHSQLAAQGGPTGKIIIPH